MKRRDLLKSAAAIGTMGALPWTSSAAAPDAAQAFSSSFTNVRDAYPPLRVRFDRPLPAGLAGTLYRNGPAGMQHGGMRYRHWFDGDGMVQAWRLGNDHVEHSARMVQTPRRRAEQAAARLLWPGFGTDVAQGRPVRGPDTVNVANISVLPAGDELLALWEAGSAWAMDPETLETRGRKVFSPQTDGLSFSAHPRVAPDGAIWNFGYLSGSGKLLLYELDQGGELKRAGSIDAPNADMVHDFVITERYLGFVLMPLRFDKQANPGSAFMNRLHWQSEAPVVVLLVDKKTWQVAHRFEVPPFFAFHFGNAWEDGDTVRIMVARTPDFDPLMQAITRATLGQAVAPLAEPPFSELVLDKTAGSARLVPLPLTGAEFPVHDPRRTGRPSQLSWLLTSSPHQPDGVFGFNSLASINRDSGRVQRYDYGAGVLAEEHVFVPGEGPAEEDGWLIGTAYDWQRQRSRISVFDAGHLADGPVASAVLPYAMPLGLHGRWWPRT